MDAVKASTEIDGSKSVAYDKTLHPNFDPAQAGYTNAMLYIDGSIDPETIDQLNLENFTEEEIELLKTEFSESMLTKENLSHLDEETLEDLRELSPEHSLTEEEVATMLEIASYYKAHDEDLMRQRTSSAGLANEMPHVACTAVTVCAAAAAVAVVVGAAAAVVAAVEVEIA